MNPIEAFDNIQSSLGRLAAGAKFDASDASLLRALLDHGYEVLVEEIMPPSSSNLSEQYATEVENLRSNLVNAAESQGIAAAAGVGLDAPPS